MLKEGSSYVQFIIMAHSHAMKAKLNIIIAIIMHAMTAQFNKSVVILGSSFPHAHLH